MRKIARRAVRLLLGGGRLVLFAAALWTLYIELGRFPTDRLIEPLSALSGLRIAGVVGLLLLSYLMASVTEALAGRYGGIRLRPGRATLAALITVGITNSASFGLLTGSGLRYRLYNAWGLTAFTTTKVLVFTTTTFALGYSVLTGVGLLSLPGGYTLLPWVPEALHLPAGAVLLASLPAYVLFALRYRAGLRFFGIRLSPPKPGEAALQALAGVAAWFAGATLLFLLLPSFGIESYGILLTAYGIAILAGIVSGLPGGIGRFAALFILILSRRLPVPELASALLAYRLIYFVVPLFIGLALLFRRERITEAPKLSEGTLRFGRRVRSVLPSLMTLAVFLSGVLLLLSGATPGRPARIAGILSILPLPVLEASHSLASVLGLMLLFLARGLQRRLLVAWVMTVALLLSATAATALRGGGLEVTAVMATTLISLLASKRDFYRRSRIVSAPLPGGWIAAIILVLLTTGWLTVFANRPVALNRFLWLEVSPESDVARSLRALGGAVAVAALLFIVRAVGHRIVPRPGEPTAESPIVRRIVAAGEATYAHLALLGDKRFLLDETQSAFIMYAITGRSWISMGDPVGPRQLWPELVWRFRELSDRMGGTPLFYEVPRESLPLYEDIGLTSLPIGEEARVDLSSFTLSGRENHDLRSARNRMRREGWEFRILEGEELEGYLPRLKAVSDAWLAAKGGRERGFALGVFDPAYLRNFPIAVVEREQEVIAFANLWESAKRQEASVDLMRHNPEAPSQTMDFLFVELLEREREAGFREFNLGLAPLSGMEEGELAPLYHRLAGLLFRHGENFYSFQGLRSYKEKFHPRWEPRYLVSPGGFGLLTGLLSLVRLATTRK